MIIETYSQDETEKIGYDTAIKALPGQVYCLSGDLGVGKTVFTRGFARGLGIDEHITGWRIRRRWIISAATSISLETGYA